MIEPLGQRLSWNFAPFDEQFAPQRWRCHPQNKLEQVFRFIHRLTESDHDLVHLLLQDFPDSSLDSLGVPQNNNLDLVLLAVAIQSPHPLVESHRVPRKVNVDKAVAALLKINALATSLGRHHKSNSARIKPLGCLVALQEDALRLSRRKHDLVGAAVTVDECGRSLAEF